MTKDDTAVNKNGVKNDLLLVENPSENKDSWCECEHTPNGLHQFHCIPKHLAFNEYILSGYRVDLTTWQCIKSLLYLHNETFNIYSHALPCLLFILAAPYVYGTRRDSSFDPLLYSIHYIAGILCSLLSTVYHAGKCHKKGGPMYEKLLTFDMVGIWLAANFSNIAFIKATFYCFYWPDKLVLPLYTFVTFIGLIWLVRQKTFLAQVRPLACLTVFRIPFFVSRTILSSRGYPTAHVSTTWFFLISEFAAYLGSFVSFTRFPERWFPGKLDYFGNSHSILHVLVIVCPLACHFGSVFDFEWMANTTCHS